MTILKMSFLASVLILVIIVIRLTMIRWLPKKTFSILWSVALCRLLIPFFASSKLSILSSVNIVKNGLLNTNVHLKSTCSDSVNIISYFMPGVILPEDAVQDIVEKGVQSIKILWIIGFCACSIFFLKSHLGCLKKYKMSLPVEDLWIDKWRQEHCLRRKIQIRQSDRINSALTYGLFKPIVLLPKNTNWTNKTQLSYILTHEYAHIKSFDVILKWFLAFSLCVHWFNPLVWLMYILANRDIELSCDETVIWSLGETEKYSYALTLIELEEQKSRFIPFANHFSKNPIEERMVCIMKIRRKSFWGMFAAFLIVISTTVACTTEPFSETHENIDFAMETDTFDEEDDFSKMETENVSVALVESKRIINLVNGTASEHDVLNGELILYKEQGKIWSLKRGESVNIDITIETYIRDGQTVVIGYIVDNCYADIFSGKIKQNKSVEFIAPKDGDYAFYLIGASSDRIHIKSISAS